MDITAGHGTLIADITGAGTPELAVSLTTIFIASLLGSPHCAGMCGGFVAFYAGNSCSRATPHIAYSLGRLSTYLVLGAICSLLGQSIDALGSASGFGRFSALVAGVLMIVWGLGKLFPSARPPAGKLSGFVSDNIGSILQRLIRCEAHEKHRTYMLGCVTTLIPCGWLYAFLGLALASGSLLNALAVMFVFWLGTLPVMLSLGIFARQISLPLRKHLPVVTAVLLMAAGAFSLLGFFTSAHHHHHHNHVVIAD